MTHLFKKEIWVCCRDEIRMPWHSARQLQSHFSQLFAWAIWTYLFLAVLVCKWLCECMCTCVYTHTHPHTHMIEGRVRALVAQRLKHLPPMQEARVWSLGWEDPLEKEIVTHSSILAWRIPWTEEPGRLQSTGSQRVGHNWATSPHFKSSGETRCLNAWVWVISAPTLWAVCYLQWNVLSLHYWNWITVLKTWSLGCCFLDHYSKWLG